MSTYTGALAGKGGDKDGGGKKEKEVKKPVQTNTLMGWMSKPKGPASPSKASSSAAAPAVASVPFAAGASAMEDEDEEDDVVVRKAGSAPSAGASASAAAGASPAPSSRASLGGSAQKKARTASGAAVPTARAAAVLPPLRAGAGGPGAALAGPGALEGQVVVVTGETERLTRDQLATMVKELGGTCPGTVSSRTTMLVCGTKLEDGRPVEAGSKWREAQEQNDKAAKGERGFVPGKGKGKGEVLMGPITIYSEADFFAFLAGTATQEQRDSAAAAEAAETERFAAFRAGGAGFGAGSGSGGGGGGGGSSSSSSRSRKVPPAEMKVGELKAALAAQGVDTSGMLEKEELIRALESACGDGGGGDGGGSSSSAAAAAAAAAGPRGPSNSDDRALSGLWTDKYAPTTFDELVGNGPFVKSLDDWLRFWDARHVAKTMPVPPKAAGTMPGSRCALISGPPGIGKTTTAALLGRRHGYEVLELNASDNRAARHVKNLLGGALGSGTLAFGAGGGGMGEEGGGSGPPPRRLVIMDEVDGMSAGDRGGSQELIKLIKAARCPIIAICNDRQNPKVRTLANHCYDLKFARPTKMQIAERVLRIAAVERVALEPAALDTLVESCGSDMRQILNTLQMWAVSSAAVSGGAMREKLSSLCKDANLRLDGFSAVPKMFAEARSAKLEARAEYFFVDYDMAPLLIQQVYTDAIVRSAPSGVPQAKLERDQLARLARAADAISQGDVFLDAVRSRNMWSMLPDAAMAFTAATTAAACAAPPNVMFPTWLGKNSSRGKRARLLAEMGLHMGANVSAGREAIRLDMLDPMRTRLLVPLTAQGLAEDPLPTIAATIKLLDEYGLSKADLMETMVEVIFKGDGFVDFSERIDSKVRPPPPPPPRPAPSRPLRLHSPLLSRKTSSKTSPG
jgi:replication factor C subunit 1